MKTSALFPSGLAVNLTSNDAEEMREHSLFWSYEHKQFSRGVFEGKISGFHTRRLQIAYSSRSVGFFIRGGLPAETTIISLPLLHPESFHYRGQLMEKCQGIALKQSEELELHTTLPTSLLTIAVSSTLLEERTRAIKGNSFDSLIISRTCLGSLGSAIVLLEYFGYQLKLRQNINANIHLEW